MKTLVSRPVTNVRKVAVLDVELSRGSGGLAGEYFPRRKPLGHDGAAAWVWVAYTHLVIVVQNLVLRATFGDLATGL